MPLGVFVPASLDDLAGNVKTEPSQQGSVIYKSATFWNSLPPGAAGQVLTSGGVGANPAWASVVSLAPATPTFNTIQPAADVNAGLILKGHSPTQSEPLLTVLSSAGGVEWQVGPSGRMGVNGPAAGSAALGGGTPVVWARDDGSLANVGFAYQLLSTNDRNAVAGYDMSGNTGFGITALGLCQCTQFLVQNSLPVPAYDALVYVQPNIGQTTAPLQVAAVDGNPFFNVETDGRATFWRTPATGFGVNVGTISAGFLDNTRATFKGRLTGSAADFNGAREGLRIEADGTAARIGFLGAAASPRITLPVAAVDATTTQALANALRSLAITFGLGA